MSQNHTMKLHKQTSKYCGIIIVFILCASCTNNTKAPELKSENKTEQKSTNPELNSDTEKHNLKNRVIVFFNWYADNLNTLNHIELLNNDAPYDPETVDTTKLYSVNFENTEKYLAVFKKSGLVSDTYLKNQRTYFKDCEKNFIENPQYEGAPSGFDYDLVMISQDYEDDLKPGHLQVEIVEVSKDKAKVMAKFRQGNKLKIDLSKENGLWKIDHISL